jgi:hypothetical protein
MVSLVWATIAASAGLACYLAIPMFGPAVNIRLRNRIAQYYYGLAARPLGRITLVRRRVGGYSLKPMKIDDEKAAAKVVLDDNMLGDSKELHFDDPDNRMKRWKSKPLTVIHEDVPGGVDPQLAELGYHLRQHIEEGKHEVDETTVNPHFEVPDESTLRCVDIDDVKALVPNGAKPTDVKTVEGFTRKRFEKYRDSVGAMEVLTTFTGFAVGLGGMAVLAYVRTKILGDGGGSTPNNPIPIDAIDAIGSTVASIATHAPDLVIL